MPKASRAWLVAAGGVAALAALARLHNAFRYAPLYDFDAPGHALNVFALYEGRLPDPHSWAGFHPILFHALGAALWGWLPEGLPVHVQLRLLSALAGLVAVALVWRTLQRLAAPADAAVVTALLFCAPVVAIASGMLGNETTCALFTTAVLARLTALPSDPAAAPRHALVTAALGTLAALAKSTGVVAIGCAAVVYALRFRRTPRAALAAAAIAGLAPLLVLGPFYARLVVAQGGSPAGVVSGAALSPAALAEMREHPPGERQLADYFSLPLATFLAPVHWAPGLDRSVPGLLYASTWADGHAQFLPGAVPAVRRAGAALAVAGLLPTGLALLGCAALGRRRARDAAGPLLFLALLLAALARYVWIFPHYSAVKASYLLPAMLPLALLVVAGLGALPDRARPPLRALLLAIALAATGFTWQGWWE